MVVLLSHPDQIQDIIFGDEGVMKGYPQDSLPQSCELYLRAIVKETVCVISFAGLQKGAVLILSSTISPFHLQKLEKEITGCNLIL